MEDRERLRRNFAPGPASDRPKIGILHGSQTVPTIACRHNDDATRAMTDGSSGSTSSTVTRLAIVAAAVGAAGYAYYLATKARPTATKASATSVAPADPEPTRARPDADDPVAQALADELAEAIEADAKNAETFPQTQTPEEIAELQRQAAVQMARLQAGGNMGQDGAGGMKNLTPRSAAAPPTDTPGPRPSRRSSSSFPSPRTSRRSASPSDSTPNPSASPTRTRPGRRR